MGMPETAELLRQWQIQILVLFCKDPPLHTICPGRVDTLERKQTINLYAIYLCLHTIAKQGAQKLVARGLKL